MDPKVRAYAVHCLENLPDDELALFMLQLCQQLKFERYGLSLCLCDKLSVKIVFSTDSYVDSALARFLLRRALAKPRLIGHIYFWLLQSEVHHVDVSKRCVILLQVMLLVISHPFSFIYSVLVIFLRHVN